MGKSHLRNFGFRVIRASVIENLSGHCRTFQDETYGTLAILVRKGLKSENVDALIGEGLAQLSKRSWPVFESDRELLHGGHGRNLLTVGLGEGLEDPCEMQRCPESYSCEACAARRHVLGRVPKTSVCGQRYPRISRP